MPGIGHDSLRVAARAHAHGEAVGPLLENHTGHSGRQGHHARGGKCLTMERAPCLAHPRAEYHHAHGQQRHAYDGRGEGLVLAVPKVMPVVCRLAAKAHKHQHHHIGGEVGERMHGIGNHRGRVAEHARRKFDNEQHHIDDAARDGHSVNVLFSVHGCMGLFLHLSVSCPPRLVPPAPGGPACGGTLRARPVTGRPPRPRTGGRRATPSHPWCRPCSGRRSPW